MIRGFWDDALYSKLNYILAGLEFVAALILRFWTTGLALLQFGVSCS
jgi:hypothetical protein